LLILTGITSAAGTLVLQRPQTDPEHLARAYAPETLRWLDRLGLTDTFHSWWFAALLGLLGLNIVLASVERFPVAWRYFARPYRRPAPHFLAGLSLQKEIPIRNQESGTQAAERAFRRLGLRPQRVANSGSASLYAEQNRSSRLAAYVVHASLLLIFAGGIADALWGYRGYLSLTRGQQTNQIEVRDGVKRTLPFTVRCDAAGRENYPDGSPRRWWSQLAVIENGREVARNTIEVNQPLVFRGIRFYQSGYGSTGEVGGIRLRAARKADPAVAREIVLRPGEALPLDADTSVRLAAFFPDFMLRGKQVENRSDQLNNPAVQLAVESKTAGETRVWLFPRFPNFSHPDSSPYGFEVRDLEMGYFTGLQVSHEPGQWAVWAGVILLGVGLAMAFYLVHARYWAVPVSDSSGRLVLWVGAKASKNRDEFAERFVKLVAEIENNLNGTGERLRAKSGGPPEKIILPASS
jgi:cytochrome c biogenesis protein